MLRLNPALQAETAAEYAAYLHQRGVTDLLYSAGDIRFFQDFMPGDSAERATSFLVDDFLPTCGHAVYNDANATLYEIDC